MYSLAFFPAFLGGGFRGVVFARKRTHKPARAGFSKASGRGAVRLSSRLHEMPGFNLDQLPARGDHNRHVVRDEQEPDVEPGRQLHEQIDHLRLSGDIQRGHALVGDDDCRVERQGPRDADALRDNLDPKLKRSGGRA